MDPSNPGTGIIEAFVTLVVSGIGLLLVTPLIGVAAIPQGFIIAFETLLGGLTSWAVSFVDGFFAPFETAVACGPDIAACDTAIAGTQQANIFVAGFGLLGFVAAMIVVGAMVYVTSWGVSKVVGYVV